MAVLQAIQSYEQLRILLLLREQPGSWCTVESLASRLCLAPSDADSALAHLLRRHLVETQPFGHVPLFRYNPRDANVRQSIDDLAQSCNEQTVEVMKLMSQQALARVRARAFETFKDALCGGRKSDN